MMMRSQTEMNESILNRINQGEATMKANKVPTKVQAKRFPYRLHEMLNDAEAHGHGHIVSWLPCGKISKVYKHKELAARVMPRYCHHSKYKSFLRQEVQNRIFATR
jgi:hypothetical protein